MPIYDDLHDMLELYEGLVHEEPWLATNAGGHSPVATAARSIVGRVPREELPRGAVAAWTAAVAAWTASTPGSRRERGVLLYQLLRRLDQHFAAKPLTHIETRVGHLVLGGRCWFAFEQHLPHERQTLRGRPLSVERPFPHLRAVPKTASFLWLDPEAAKAALRRPFRDGELRVGLYGFSGKAKTHFRGTRVVDESPRTFGFVGDGILPTELHRKEVEDAVAWAALNHVDILCMPELCVDANGRAALVAALERTPGVGGLVVPGSFHVEAGGDWVSEAPLWLVRDSKVYVIARTTKQEPFYLSVADAGHLDPALAKSATDAGAAWLREDMAAGNDLVVLPTPFGTLGVLICRDDLTANARAMLYDLLLDHLVVVSMNEGPKAWFWAHAEKRRLCGLATYYVNASQAVAPAAGQVDLAFALVPAVLPEEPRQVRVQSPGHHGGAWGPDGRVLFTVKWPKDFVSLT